MLYEALLGTVRLRTAVCSPYAADSKVKQTPFWADNTNDMYARVLHEELTFPNDRNLDRDTRSFLRGVSHECLHDDVRVLIRPVFRSCCRRIHVCG